MVEKTGEEKDKDKPEQKENENMGYRSYSQALRHKRVDEVTVFDVNTGTWNNIRPFRRRNWRI